MEAKLDGMSAVSLSPLALGVYIDHVATVRQARGTRYPEPVHAALLAEQAGADSITLHLREDRRHIQNHDLETLAAVVQTHLNLEIAITDEMLAIAARVRPRDCCLVPERRQELTTEGGLDVIGQHSLVTSACQQLAASGIRVSLFVDPDLRQLDAAREAGAPVVELHTGAYAEANNPAGRRAEFERLVQSVRHGTEIGLEVNAGHGLNYHNVQPVAALPDLQELNIGHAIISRAIFVGMVEAVREMKRLLVEARR